MPAGRRHAAAAASPASCAPRPWPRPSAAPLSAHCAPALHLHVGLRRSAAGHVEWFHDHVRIERLLLDGAPEPVDGEIAPDRTRPGNGFELRRADPERYAA